MEASEYKEKPRILEALEYKEKPRFSEALEYKEKPRIQRGFRTILPKEKPRILEALKCSHCSGFPKLKTRDRISSLCRRYNFKFLL